MSDEKLLCNCPPELMLYLGAGVLVLVFGIASYWIPDFRQVAAVQFGAIVGAAARGMKS